MALNDIVDNLREVPHQSISKAIDSHIKKREELPNSHGYGWHPSSFCDMCVRQRVISDLVCLEKADDLSPRLFRIFDVGTAMHRWYQEEYLGPLRILWGPWRCSRCHRVLWGFMPKVKCDCEIVQKTKKCVHYCSHDGQFVKEEMDERGGCLHCGKWGRWEYLEIPFYYDAKLSEPYLGHCDGIIRLNDIWYLLEIKTINSFGFSALWTPKPAHVLQGQAYSELIRRQAVKNLPKALPKVEKIILLYLGKNTSDEKEFVIDVDQEVGEEVLLKPVNVENSLRIGELPERHEECEEKTSKRAKKCDMKKFCFAKNVNVPSLKLYGDKYGRRSK